MPPALPSLLLALSLLLTAPARAQSPTKAPAPAARPDRVTQYYQDYLERLRAVYFAPGDPRATFLLSSATDELSARRKALRAELAAGMSGKTVGLVREPAGWRQQLNALNQTPQAVKFLDRSRRNAALETVYQRFLDARLDELFPKDH